MSETNPNPAVSERPKSVNTGAGAALDWGVGPLLNAQADLLAGAEVTVTEWLHRRQEAVVDTRQLIASMQTGSDPADAFRAQRDWMSRSFKRLAADADAYHSVAQKLIDHAPAWFPRGGWMGFPLNGAATDAAASQAAATRAVSRPLRMANRPE